MHNLEKSECSKTLHCGAFTYCRRLNVSSNEVYNPVLPFMPFLQITQTNICRYHCFTLLFCLSSNKTWQHYNLESAL